VELINVHGTAKSGGSLQGLVGSPITNIKFTNCNITAQTGLKTSDVKDVDYSGLNLQVTDGKPIINN